MLSKGGEALSRNGGTCVCSGIELHLGAFRGHIPSSPVCLLQLGTVSHASIFRPFLRSFSPDSFWPAKTSISGVVRDRAACPLVLWPGLVSRVFRSSVRSSPGSSRGLDVGAIVG